MPELRHGHQPQLKARMPSSGAVHAPNKENLTVSLDAGPKSDGPAVEMWAIIHPPITNRTMPMASATRYGTAGHQKRGRPYLQVSGSLPHDRPDRERDTGEVEDPADHQRCHKVPGERGEARGHADEQERHDHGADDAEDRTGQQPVRLAEPR